MSVETQAGRWLSARTGDGRADLMLSRGGWWVSWNTVEHRRRRGVATDLAGQVLAVADAAGITETWALIRPWNTASLGLAAKLGYVEAWRSTENVTLRRRNPLAGNR